jgi:hypothetical protein
MSLSAFPVAAQNEKDGPKPQSGKAALPTATLLAQPVPGYRHVRMEGFDLLINREVFAHSGDAQYKRKPLDVLELELGTINRVVPPRIAKVLRKIVVWVEWDEKDDPDIKNVVAKYYTAWGETARLWVLNSNKHPGKLNNVEIISMRNLTAGNQPGSAATRRVILHELCHAVHINLLGIDNPYIKAAYQQAMERKLYEESTDTLGQKVVPYARTNAVEYFAELSGAYLDKQYYYPHTRDDLEKHDPLGYQVMERVWGTPKQLDAVLKAESEKTASQKLSAARKLRAEGKEAEARATLEKIVEYYPKTRAAPDAKALLNKSQP